MTTISKYILVVVLFLLPLLLSCSSNDDANSSATNYTSVDDLLTEINFQGYAIVTKNGNDLVRQGYGFANESTAMPQDYELSYRIGSVSKTLTAAAIIQLKRDGLITSFNQTLNEFDPDFPNGNQLTIAHLLSHQSGIPEYQFVVENAYEQGEVLNEEAIYELVIDLITEGGLTFLPGTNKHYCNSNYLIAAFLVQRVAQMPFHQYVQQNILTPLGMTNTHKGNNVIDTNTHAQGYLNGSVNSNYPMAIPFGAGDFSSTPEDMEMWANAVKTSWFTEAEKELIFAQNVPSGFVDFGLGWFTTQEHNTTMYWHGGDINGYWSMIGFIPAYDATLVLLSNRQDDTGTQRNAIIQQLLTNEFNYE